MSMWAADAGMPVLYSARVAIAGSGHFICGQACNYYFCGGKRTALLKKQLVRTLLNGV